MKYKQSLLFLCLFIGVVMICVWERELIYVYMDISSMDTFRMMAIDQELWNKQEEQYGKQTDQFYDKLTVCMMQTKLEPMKNKKTLPGFLFKIGIFKSKYKEYGQIYRTVMNDIRCFPVAADARGGQTVAFDDSWGGARTYGGKRKHEGTDIMTSNNERGYFPILSVSDGIVEKKGWLPQGGYRLGIRSRSGAYFYYAHLHSYAEGIEEGTAVRAGELIGFMGDTGYSEIEGTVGNFDVHLHFGIYIDYKGEETSVNPYHILRHFEDEKRQFYNRY